MSLISTNFCFKNNHGYGLGSKFINTNIKKHNSNNSIGISGLDSSNSSSSSNNSMKTNTTIIARFGYQTIVILLIIVCYVYILNFAIFPQIETTEYKGRINGILSSILTVLILSNYYLASTTNPGSYKDTLSPSYYLVHPPSEDVEKRFCNKCNEQKVERAHHCRYCNRCVLRMDHHCLWLQNCVGLFNQKYFVLFLWYSSISIIYFFYLLIDRSLEIVSTHALEHTLPEIDIFQLILLGMLIIVLVVAVITLVSLLFNQLWMITKNVTTIEIEDAKRKGSVLHYKKYDRSILNNYIQIFGDPSIFWLLPTSPKNNKQFNSKKGDIFIV
ncbi:cell cycle regulator with zn-finger domain [Tieghemostelium lacteum]|uniref:Palmitoyltransferase n=1 Tax=Tieghemostelium lacteum TaxID=361077 RepID=A0A151Z5Z4_TIELA|nr:cell cycle regulator with zn-finger domain [Tieghemostelium lacteum]|eukprot:KYQ89380.1 cell cycle regulator with zn-finger domain [Tieghemostelium lacteum]